MQTFLPYPSFAESACVLDNKRLGKQRVEVLQILRTLTDQSGGWRFHPAVGMWRRYEAALVEYGLIICSEWIRRGFQDSCANKIVLCISCDDFLKEPENPSWLGNKSFHLSHQSNLVRKFPEHYRKFFPDVPDDLPYVWPIKKEEIL